MCTMMCIVLEGVDKTVNKRHILVAMERKKAQVLRIMLKFPEERTKILFIVCSRSMPQLTFKLKK